jgi:hypothetical protein
MEDHVRVVLSDAVFLFFFFFVGGLVSFGQGLGALGKYLLFVLFLV